MNIQYKTRAAANPQGKHNLWIAHAGEDAALIDAIAADILTYQNCAVWYDADYDGENDTSPVGILEDLLSEIQLMVIPVSTRLLARDNRVLTREFAWAKEHHTPVLPILVEGGLAPVFNERFSNLQCLDRVSFDDTVLSYEEKLRDYLEAVLHTDEMTDRIKSSFRSNLFLSYRKRDRAHAQKLMRAIHETDEMRDVAIWYDEYLIPGENFNDAILTSLADSDAMLLAVTPSLVSEDNYVQSVEYPRAREMNKPIIPVEMLPTEHDAMQTRYAGIGDILPLSDTATIQDRIAEALGTSVPAVLSPTRRYLLALAYLNGTSVEIDTAYAGRALYRCALDASPEAVEQLASMYRYGIGIDKNARIAENWYKRLVSLRAVIVRETPCDENTLLYVHALEELGDFCIEAQKNRAAIDNYTTAVRTLRDMAGDNDEAIAALCEKTGLACRFMKDFDGAAAHYNDALAMRARLPHNYENLFATASLKYRIGDVLMAQEADGDNEAALACYLEAEAIVTDLLRTNASEETRRLFCIVLEKIGDYYRHNDDIEEAREYYQRYAEETSALVGEYATIPAKRLYSIACERLGVLAVSDYENEEALGHFERALAIRKEIARENETYEAFRDLAVIYQKIGDVYLDDMSPDEAEEYFDLSYRHASALYETTKSTDAAFDCAVIEERMGDIAAMRDADIDVVAELYTNALTSFKTIAGNLISPPLSIAEAPAKTMDHLAIAYLNVGDMANAKDYFNRAIDHRMYLYSSGCEAKSLVEAIGAGYHYLEQIAIREMNFREMGMYGEYAENPMEAIRNESESCSYRMSLDDFDEDNDLLCEADDAYSNGDYDTALNHYLTAARGYLGQNDRAYVTDRLEELAFYYARHNSNGAHISKEVCDIFAVIADNAYTDDYTKIMECINTDK